MNINKTKVISLKSNTAGVIPTVPTVSNHKTPGWLSPTDIYEGEFFFNTADQALYLRAGNSIIQIGGATVSRYLDDLLDVDAATPSSADILTFDGTNWISKQTFDGVLNVDETLRSVYQEGCTLGALAARSFATGLSTYVSGSYGHSEGAGTSASNYAHAEGQNTIASGDISHSEGNQTTASGTGAHSEGLSTLASGAYSHSSGREAVASRNYQYSQGGGKIATAGDAQFCRMIYKVQTTNDTTTTIATFNTETNHIYAIRALGLASVKAGGATGSSAVFSTLDLSGDITPYTTLIKNIDGVVTRSAANILIDLSSDTVTFPGTGYIQLDIVGTNGIFKVTGAAATTINWVLTLEWTETII